MSLAYPSGGGGVISSFKWFFTCLPSRRGRRGGGGWHLVHGMDIVPAYVDWRDCTATPLFAGVSWLYSKFRLKFPPQVCRILMHRFYLQIIIGPSMFHAHSWTIKYLYFLLFGKIYTKIYNAACRMEDNYSFLLKNIENVWWHDATLFVLFFIFYNIHTYIHTITFKQYFYPSPFAEASLHIFIACLLSGGTSLWCRAENRTRACLTAKYWYCVSCPGF